jgi:chemotaxis protein methyltransferase CheR
VIPLANTLSPDLQPMFEEFQAYLYEASGIYFSAQNRDRLLRYVAARMEAVGKQDPKEYLALLRSSRPGAGEQAAFFNQATVNETYFLREEQQLTVFQDKVLPHLYQARLKQRRPKVVIWSAACSSGEEAYSLALQTFESFPLQLNFTSIIGFDINSEVIAWAKAGESRSTASVTARKNSARSTSLPRGNTSSSGTCGNS